MRNALEVASRSAEVEEKKAEPPTALDPQVKTEVDKRVAAHDPLKGISKSLLERIRAKQVTRQHDTLGDILSLPEKNPMYVMSMSIVCWKL